MVVPDVRPLKFDDEGEEEKAEERAVAPSRRQTMYPQSQGIASQEVLVEEEEEEEEVREKQLRGSYRGERRWE